MMPQKVIDETYSPLRIFESPTTSDPSKATKISDDKEEAMMGCQPMEMDASSTRITNLHMIHFDPQEMLQDCDDFSVSSSEAESFVDDDFCFVSNNSDAFWEQGIISLNTLERQTSASNVTITSEDGTDSMQISAQDS
jgi:hypothetical protein